MNKDILPFLKETGLPVWRNLLERFGSREAERMAKMGRQELMLYLRTEKHWTLEMVGDLLNLSRERIRQLTPPGLWEQEEKVVISDDEFEKVLRKAARTPEAWHDSSKGGGLSMDWMANELQVSIHAMLKYSEGPFATLGFKPMILLKYGMGLETEENVRAWYEEQYWTFANGFEALAKKIRNKTGVPIQTMSVWRYFRKDLRMSVRGRGEYERKWSYRG